MNPVVHPVVHPPESPVRARESGHNQCHTSQGGLTRPDPIVPAQQGIRVQEPRRPLRETAGNPTQSVVHPVIHSQQGIARAVRPAREGSPAWAHLRSLQVGDRVPLELYVLDYRDGTRPRWTIAQVEELASGGRRLVLVDPDNGPEIDGVAVTVLTWASKTLKSQPHRLGAPCGHTLCDLDQQGRREGAA